MALITCKECGKSVSSQAASCPHCGAPVSAPEKKSSGCGCAFALLGAIVIIALLGLISAGSSNAPGAPQNSVSVEVRVSRVDLRITNHGTANWTECVVYINGTPPFTYKARVQAPSVGESVRIPLSDFVDRDGERFNPFTHAVTTVWIGGGGYDYSAYNVSR